MSLENVISSAAEVDVCCAEPRAAIVHAKRKLTTASVIDERMTDVHEQGVRHALIIESEACPA